MKSASLLAGKGETFVRDLVKRGQKPSVENLRALAAVLDVSVSFLSGEEEFTVPIVGRVAANADGQILYSEGDGFLGETKVPSGASERSVAVEVEGHSMGFIADGALVYYENRSDPPTDDMLGHIVVVGLTDGRALLKRLLRGSQPGLYDLESINGPILRDQVVEWAAHIDSIVPAWRASRIRK